MEEIMDIELWLNETFGPLDTSSNIAELDAVTEGLFPDADFALHALPGRDVASTDGEFLPSEVSAGNLLPVIDSGGPLRISRSSGEMTLVKRRYAAQWNLLLIDRTRRILRPIVEGNNQHGNKGKRRCLQCRTWKQKVFAIYSQTWLT
jgi:hypothetical protein